MSFAEAQDAFFADFFRLYPVHATDAGNHEHDDRWPDLSDAGGAERLAWLASARAGLESAGGLSREEEIDRRVLLATIDELRFDEEELDELSWSPIVVHLPARRWPLLARLAGVRTARAAARERGGTDGGHSRGPRCGARQPHLGRGRPVATFHVEKAIETMPGVADLCRTSVEMASDADDTTRDRVTAAAEPAIAAVEAFTSWMRDELLPSAGGDFRLGRDLYERKFHHALKATITPDELERRAAATYDEVRAEMLRLARDLWPEWVGDEPMPDDPNVLTRRVLDAIGADHPKADDLLDFCTAEHERILDFVRERDLIGLPDDPLQIIWTPPFLRAFGGAMLIPPGPLDKGLDSFFAITPPPDSWTDEQVESMLRENNGRSLKVLTIHEATPGHYLQLAWSNRCESLARAVFGSGVFAEGWAVYVTQVMMDAGYADGDPALMLAHLEVLPPRLHQHVDGHPHPHRLDDRGRGDVDDGRRRLPGAVGGFREVEPRAPLEHAAVLVLPRQRRDDRARARSSSPRRR